MASTSLISQLSTPHLSSSVCKRCIKRPLNVNRCHTKHLSRRYAILAAAASTLLAREAFLSEHNLALGFEFRLTVPDQTVEEAEGVIRDHARTLLSVKTLIDSEDWELQEELRKKSSFLKQDIFTMIQSKPGMTRPLLRKRHFELFNNVTKLDYAARDKDVACVQECYENISTALNDILSRISVTEATDSQSRRRRRSHRRYQRKTKTK